MPVEPIYLMIFVNTHISTNSVYNKKKKKKLFLLNVSFARSLLVSQFTVQPILFTIYALDVLFEDQNTQFFLKTYIII